MPEHDRFALGLDYIPGKGGVLCIRALDCASLHDIGSARLTCEQSFRPEHDRLAQAGFKTVIQAEGDYSAVLLSATRSKAETLGNIARGWAMLETGGVMLVNADKAEGADSLLRQLRATLPVTEALPKSHGRLVRLEKAGEAAPDWASDLNPRPNALGFHTAPGMFSVENADAGSRLLANLFSDDLTGKVADLGAGWGYLSVQALLRAPGIAEIHLFEAEAKALDCARLNLTGPKAAFHWSDVTGLDRSGAFDTVICNPPFHAARASDPALGNAFITAAARILKPNGKAWFVANRNLPYEATLDAAFVKVTRVAQDSGFKAFLCERPKKARR